MEYQREGDWGRVDDLEVSTKALMCMYAKSMDTDNRTGKAWREDRDSLKGSMGKKGTSEIVLKK